MRPSPEPAIGGASAGSSRSLQPGAANARLGIVLVSFVAAAVACFWSSDGDLGFHLATGREVLATGQIPTHNVLSFAEPEHAWQLHQWLPGVLFELLHRTFGISAVIGLKMAVVAATWAVVFCTARRVGASAASSALVCLLGAAASAVRFEARPYLFTHLTLALILFAYATFAGSYQRHAGARMQLAAASALVALGCQLHAGALDGSIALVVLALGVAIEPLRGRCFGVAAVQPAGLHGAARPALAALCGMLAGAALLAAYHPLGARILLFPFEMAGDTYLAEHLVEFRRPWTFPLASLAAFWVLLTLWAALAAMRMRFIHAAWLMLALAFAVLSLRFVRMVFAFSIAAAPSLALAIEHTRAGTGLRARPRLAAFVLVACALAVPLYTFRDRTPGFGYEPSIWPMPHFDFIRDHGIRGNAYVSDAWGGPFLGRFYPERRVFFDNRLEAYSPRFVRDVYQRIRYAEPGWEALLDHYAIELLLLRYTTQAEGRFQHGAPNLRQQLARDPRFTLVRFDDVGELFVRTTGPNAALADRFALRGIDPDRRRFTGDPRTAAASLLQALQRGERSATLMGLAALAIAARGQTELAQRFAREAARIAPDDAWAHDLAAQLSASELPGTGYSD